MRKKLFTAAVAFGSDIQRLRLSDVAGIEKRDYKLLQDYRHQQTVEH